MSNNKSNNSKRKLLKSIAAGSGAVVAGKSLPESWARPIVNSIVLPAHAATTATDARSTSLVLDAGGTSGDLEYIPNFGATTDFDDTNLIAKISEIIVPTAHADIPRTIIYRWTVCVTPTAVEGTYSVEVMLYSRTSMNGSVQAISTFAKPAKAELTVGASKGVSSSDFGNSCGLLTKGAKFSIKLNSYADGSGTVSLDVPAVLAVSATVDFKPGGCNLDAVKCLDPRST